MLGLAYIIASFDWLHYLLFSIAVFVSYKYYMIWSAYSQRFGAGPRVSAEAMVDFLLVVGMLKRTKRTGWINHKVKLPESVSDHMYRLAMMSFCIQDPKIDRDRLAKVGLVHDVAEAVVGDIVPTEYSGVSKAEKHKREVEALEKIAGLFEASPSLRNEFKSLWYEYETGHTNEGSIMKQMDRLEMIVQAYEYERDQRCRLDDFFNSTAKMFTHPELLAIQQEILRRRVNLHATWTAEWIEHGIPVPQPIDRSQHAFCSGEVKDVTGEVATLEKLLSPTKARKFGVAVVDVPPPAHPMSPDSESASRVVAEQDDTEASVRNTSKEASEEEPKREESPKQTVVARDHQAAVQALRMRRPVPISTVLAAARFVPSSSTYNRTTGTRSPARVHTSASSQGSQSDLSFSSTLRRAVVKGSSTSSVDTAPSVADRRNGSRGATRLRK